jgi:hypothetical protein
MKMKKWLAVFLILAVGLLAGCGESQKEASEESLKEELSGGWALEKVEHYVPEDYSASSKISESSAQAECSDTHLRINWSSDDIANSLEQKGTLEASFNKLPERFAPGEEVSITVDTQSSFSANYESDIFRDGRFARAYVITPGRDDVMNPYAQLYAPALWYETSSDSKGIPLNMPSDARGGETVQIVIGLDDVPHPNGAPAVTYTYRWTE